MSDSGKLSFRQEVVRKAMVAFKAGEKFKLDSHARMREAIEQYLFEERRDVLRLVTSTARPGRGSAAEDLGRAAATDHRIRLRRAQREGSIELRHDTARTGVARAPKRSTSERMDEADGKRGEDPAPAKWYELFSRGARDWLRHDEKVRESVREHSAADRRRRRSHQRRRTHRARAGAHARALSLPPAPPRGAAGRGPGQGQARRRARRPVARQRGPGEKGAGRPGRRRGAAAAGVQGRRHRRLAVGGDAAAQSQGARRPVRGNRLDPRGLGPARRALAPRPAALLQGAGQAARRAGRDPDLHRRGPALPAAGAAQAAGDPCGGVLHAGRLGQHVRPRSQARQDLLLLGGAGPAARIPLARDGVRRAHHRGVGVHRAGILPGERHRRHGRLHGLLARCARSSTSATTPVAATSICSTPPTATTR